MGNEPVLNSLGKFAGKQAVTEWHQLSAGIRKVMRLTLPVENESQLFAVAAPGNYHVWRSPLPVNQSGGGQHLASFGSVSAANSIHYYYIGPDEGACRMANLWEINFPDRLGRLLGYPECCIQFFLKNFSQQMPDLTPAIAPPHSIHHWQLNRLVRPFTLAPISHFPCTWNCPPSLEIANQTLSSLNEADPVLMAECCDLLQTNVCFAPGYTLLTKDFIKDCHETALPYRQTGFLPPDTQTAFLPFLNDFLRK